MVGKVIEWDERTGRGHILFGDHIRFCFDSSVVEGPVILRRGDAVRFDVKQVGQDERAFSIKLDR